MGETGVRHIPLTLQCTYRRTDEGGENEDRKEESQIPGVEERVESTWPLVCG